MCVIKLKLYLNKLTPGVLSHYTMYINIKLPIEMENPVEMVCRRQPFDLLLKYRQILEVL